MSKKIEADFFHGIVVVEQFNDRTRVLSDIKEFSIDDFIHELSYLVDGTIGWNASDEDIRKINECYYTVTESASNLILPGEEFLNCIVSVGENLRKNGYKAN